MHYLLPSSSLSYWCFFLLIFTCLLAILLQGQECDDTQNPVVFVHGFLASGDTWSSQIQRFASNGHCQDRYFAFDWNSLNASNTTDLLDDFIDNVLITIN